MGWFSDLFGTTKTFFKIGLAGPRLKASGENLLVRTNADGADAELTASKVKVSGDDLVINSDAAGADNDWLLTFRRNAAQTEALVVTAPAAKSTDGYVLRQKAGTSAGVLELELAAAGDTSLADKVDTTTLDFGDSSPKSMFQLPADAIITKIQVVIDTAFDGTPTASVGIDGSASKYLGTGDIDLKATAGTVFEVHPGQQAPVSAEDLEIAYSAGGASAGSARFLVFYATPS